MPITHSDSPRGQNPYEWMELITRWITVVLVILITLAGAATISMYLWRFVIADFRETFLTQKATRIESLGHQPPLGQARVLTLADDDMVVDGDAGDFPRFNELLRYRPMEPEAIMRGKLPEPQHPPARCL